MDDQPPTLAASPKPRRRWYQFSLRTLLIVMTGLMLVLVFWIIPSERQRYTVSNLPNQSWLWKFRDENREGWKDRTGLSLNGMTAPWYSHYFFRVGSLMVRGGNLTNIDWTAVPNIESVMLSDVLLTDGDIKKLSKLSRLKDICIISCKFDDLSSLNAFSQLKALELDCNPNVVSSKNTPLSSIPQPTQLHRPAKEPWIEKLQALETLRLTYVTADKQFFRQIAKLHRLKRLELWSCALTEVDDSVFRQLQSVEHLNVIGTKLSLKQFNCFKALPNLKVLRCVGLDEKKIKSIIALPQLDTLITDATSIPSERLQLFAKSTKLKNLEIHVVKVQPANPAADQAIYDEYYRRKSEFCPDMTLKLLQL